MFTHECLRCCGNEPRLGALAGPERLLLLIRQGPDNFRARSVHSIGALPLRTGSQPLCCQRHAPALWPPFVRELGVEHLGHGTRTVGWNRPTANDVGVGFADSGGSYCSAEEGLAWQQATVVPRSLVWLTRVALPPIRIRLGLCCEFCCGATFLWQFLLLTLGLEAVGGGRVRSGIWLVDVGGSASFEVAGMLSVLRARQKPCYCARYCLGHQGRRRSLVLCCAYGTKEDWESARTIAWQNDFVRIGTVLRGGSTGQKEVPKIRWPRPSRPAPVLRTSAEGPLRQSLSIRTRTGGCIAAAVCHLCLEPQTPHDGGPGGG